MQRSLAGVGEGGRGRIAGAEAIHAALARGERLRLIVLDAAADPESLALEEPARAAGVPLQQVGPRHFARLCPADTPGGAVALVGEGPASECAEVMGREGPVWLLVGVQYPGNAGFAVRTAEVSGAAGVCVDNDFDHARRREALRASMRADRFVPVLWRPAEEVVEAAREAGRRIVAVEDVGQAAPWREDLTGPVLFVVGSESQGIPEALLAACDTTVRIPMAGFIRSYNLQAAVAMVAGERMRQLDEACA